MLTGFLLIAFWLFQCTPRHPEPEAPDAGVVALYGDIRVTVEELDNHVLALPPRDRPLPGQNLDAWSEEQVREIVLGRLLLREAEEQGLDRDPAFLKARREAERKLIFQFYFRDHSPEMAGIDDKALQAAYDQHKERFNFPEARVTYHLFRRCGDPESVEKARLELEGLRDRVLRGEHFQNLAQQHSDSEARHRGGVIGRIVRGMLEPAFEEAIFALEEGVPSDPVVFGEGVHLFYVDAILPAKSLSFEEAKPRLLNLIRQERIEKALDEATSRIAVPDDAFFVDRETFNELVRADDRDAVLFRLADTEIDLNELHRRIELQASAQPTKSGHNRISGQQAWQTLEVFRKMALIEYHCKANGLVPEEELRSQLGQWERRALVAEQRRKRMVGLAEADESKLKLFFQSNIGLFSRPVRVKLRLLKLPLDEDAGATMSKLEAAAATQGSSLEALNREGGIIEDLGWKTMAELNLMQPKLPPLISACGPGQLTSPFRAGKFIEMAEVLEKEEAEPQAFEDIKTEVAAAYTERYTPQLYRRLMAEEVNTEKLKLNPEGMARFREKGMMESDIDAEEIEALLQELEPQR